MYSNRKYKSIIFLFLLLVNFSAQAQKWSLEKCINQALENNVQLQQSELGVEINEYISKTSKYDLAPTLNGSSSWASNFGRSIDPFTNQFTTDAIKSYNFSVASQVTLFNGFSKQNTIKQKGLDYQKSKADLEKSKNDLILSVSSAYLQLLLNQEALSKSITQLDNSKIQKDRIERQVKAGALAESSLAEINAQIANEEFAFVNAENQVQLAKLNLAQLLDIVDYSNYEIETPSVDVEQLILPDFDANNIFENALQSMPQIEASNLATQSAQKTYEISKARYYPSLTMSAVVFTGTSSARQLYDVTGFTQNPIGFVDGTNQTVYTYSPIIQASPNPFSNQISENMRQQISINLSIPIFNGLTIRQQVQRSSLNYKIAELSETNTKNQLRKDIEQATADYNASKKKYNAAKIQYQNISESYRNSKVRFEQGMLSFINYQTMLNNHKNAELDLLQSKYELIFRLKVLEFYQGKKINL